MIVGGGEFAAINSAAFVIERRLNEGRSKLAFVESGMGALVKSVEADVPAFHDFLGDASVEIMRALGSHRGIFCDSRLVSCAGELADCSLLDSFQWRRREITRVTDMKRGQFPGFVNDVEPRTELVLVRKCVHEIQTPAKVDGN